MVIRLAGMRDAGVIARMSRDHIEQGLAWTWRIDRVRRTLRQPEVLGAVAAIDRLTLGFAVMEYGLEQAHLLLIGVHPQVRRRGIGRALLEWHLACARVAGIETVHLEVRAHAQQAIAFYEELGFHAIKRIPNYYQGREDAVKMALVVMPRASR